MKKIFLATIIIMFTLHTYSQRSGGSRSMSERPKIGIVNGKIVDATSNAVMEYANIALYNKRDSSLITGTITNKEGNFRLTEVPLGRFYLTANFIGYNKQFVNDIKIMPNSSSVNLGKIELSSASTDIDEVTVTAEKSHINYKLDRKIVNVSQDINSTGATAVEVLENTPSVTVDIEGNVALRGSSNFTVLIDGKPSVLGGSDALQQIPSSTIENIEIITNPSAKYDPDGIGGIINVILKKNIKSGFNGIVNTSGSSNGSYKTDLLLNYKTSKFNVFGSVDYNKMKRDGSYDSKNENYYTDSTFYRYSNGDREMSRDGLTIKTGGDYYVNDNITLSTALNYGTYEFSRGSDTKIQTWYTDSEKDYSLSNNKSIRS
ncbi:MAG: carboxypeptidase-like regulatory domain-containing protein, partial [Bacteroidota bacterium]|nr:carboxypeptidase-like regulatory domain-containing protein [Bacteroidota bacterium]